MSAEAFNYHIMPRESLTEVSKFRWKTPEELKQSLESVFKDGFEGAAKFNKKNQCQ